jgi:hypothetical protein
MIRLGNVVVSKPTGRHSGAVQYDHGKAKVGQFERTGALAPPPAVLLNTAQDLAAKPARSRKDPLEENIKKIDTSIRGLRRYKHPGAAHDYLLPTRLYTRKARSVLRGMWMRSFAEDPANDRRRRWRTVHRRPQRNNRVWGAGGQGCWVERHVTGGRTAYISRLAGQSPLGRQAGQWDLWTPSGRVGLLSCDQP